MATNSSKNPKAGTVITRLSAEAVKAESLAEAAKAQVRAVKAELKKARKIAKAAKKTAKRARKKATAAQAVAAAAVKAADAAAPLRGARRGPVRRPRSKQANVRRSAGDVAKSVIDKMSAKRLAAGGKSAVAEHPLPENTAPP